MGKKSRKLPCPDSIITNSSISPKLAFTGGMPPADAKLVAKLLVKADLRGYPGHGVTRVAPYLAWIKDGTINLREGPKIVREGKITAVIEGNHYIGQAAAHMAMELAIKPRSMASV